MTKAPSTAPPPADSPNNPLALPLFINIRNNNGERNEGSGKRESIVTCLLCTRNRQAKR